LDRKEEAQKDKKVVKVRHTLAKVSYYRVDIEDELVIFHISHGVLQQIRQRGQAGSFPHIRCVE